MKKAIYKMDPLKKKKKKKLVGTVNTVTRCNTIIIDINCVWKKRAPIPLPHPTCKPSVRLYKPPPHNFLLLGCAFK